MFALGDSRDLGLAAAEVLSRPLLCRDDAREAETAHASSSATPSVRLLSDGRLRRRPFS